MLMRCWLWLSDTLKISFKQHKKIILWFCVCILAGVLIGIITLFTNDITVEDINKNFIDQNILTSTSTNAGVGSFIWQRLISAILPLILIFVLSVISGWTAMIVFPFMFMQGYWAVVSVWWVAQEYAMTAAALLCFYAIWMIVVLTVLSAVVIWVMKIASVIRRVGFRAGFNYREILTGMFILLWVEVISALFEYLVYFVFLGRIVYGGQV
jgi:hypothetical protein